MSCEKPMIMVSLGIDKETGKQHTKIINRPGVSYDDLCLKYGRDNVYFIGCGRCPDCIAKYKRNWALRCMCESIYHLDNCFITLTYDDKHYPGKRNDEDIQKFFKRLRKFLNGADIKYFACSEAGGHTGRYHFHAIIFGWFPSDAKFDFKNALGQHFYSSEILNKLWSFGFTTLSDISKDSCEYVAGYTAKKENPLKPGKLYMSRRPGLGRQFFIDNAEKIIKTGSCVLPGFGIVKVPRYGIETILNNGYLPSDVLALKDLKSSMQYKRLINNCINNAYLTFDDALLASMQESPKKSRKRGL